MRIILRKVCALCRCERDINPKLWRGIKNSNDRADRSTSRPIVLDASALLTKSRATPSGLKLCRYLRPSLGQREEG